MRPSRIAVPLLSFALACAAGVACSSSGTASSDPAPAARPPPPITLASVSPSTVTARGGEMLTLKGSGFAADTVVKVGDARAASVQVVSPNELHVVAPALWAGTATVETSGPGGDARLEGAVQVTPLDLRFVQAPTYSLSIAADVDGGADGGADASVPPPVSPPVQAAVTGDFDGDGDIDVVTCAAGELCHFLANDGKGNFEDRATSGDEPRFGKGTGNARAVVVADLDGDGDLDLVVAPMAGPPVVEVNDGKGYFTESALSWTQYGDGGAPEKAPDGGVAALDPVTALAVGDLDGDGKPELLLGNATPDQTPLRVLRNLSTRGASRFEAWSPDSVPSRPWGVVAIAIADVDGDGAADVVLSTPGAADGIELRLLLGGHGKLTEAPGALPNVAGAEASALAVADLDGDGHADIIAAGTGQDHLLINDGSGHFFDSTLTSMPLDNSSASSLVLVDLDRDRDLDLVIGNHGAVTRLYLNDGKGVFRDYTPLLPLAATDAAWVAAADVDGDADQDILFVSAAPTTPRLYLSVEKQP